MSIVQTILKILAYLLNIEEDRVAKAERGQEKAETELAVEKANDKVDADFAGKSDADIVLGAAGDKPKP